MSSPLFKAMSPTPTKGNSKKQVKTGQGRGVQQVKKKKATKTPSTTPLLGGRPVKWKPEYNDLIIKWFTMDAFTLSETTTEGKNGSYRVETKLLANKFPTLERFAASIGVDDDTLAEWARYDNEDTANESLSDSKYRCPGFHGAYTYARKMQKAIIIEGGMAGVYNPQFTIFVAQNVTDMKVKSEQQVTMSVSAELDSLDDQKNDVTINAKKLLGK